MADNTKQKKIETVSKLTDAFKKASSVVFVHFKGMNVADESAMRYGLRAEGILYTIAKKTLLRRALENLGHAHKEVPLEGEIAIAHGGTDATAVARAVYGFAKKFTDKLAIVGGIFEGRLIGQAKMQEIALIPSLQILRVMLAQVLNSPRQRFVVALSKVAEKKN